MLMFVVLQDDCNAAAGKRLRKYCPCLVTVLLFFAVFCCGRGCLYGSCFISELTIK